MSIRVPHERPIRVAIRIAVGRAVACFLSGVAILAGAGRYSRPALASSNSTSAFEAPNARPQRDAAMDHYHRGQALSDQGDWDGAIAEYRAAIRIQPDYAPAYALLGEALQQKGDLDGAIAEFQAVLRLNPNNASMHLQLGLVFEEKRDLNAALIEYRSALDLGLDETGAKLAREGYERVARKLGRKPVPQAGTTGSQAVSSAPKNLRLSAGVAEGNLIHRVEPAYPQMARIAHVQGDVVLQFLIGKDGAVENLHVVSGHAILIQAAMDAVKQWKYKPFLLNGELVEVETTVTLKFHLE
jgi:TonB family protein